MADEQKTQAATAGTVSWKDVNQGLLFFLHQFIATLGLGILAGYLVAYVCDVLYLFGKPIPSKTMYWVLTGTPYYPVQIGLGLLSGWLIGRRVRHQAMLWVWVLPLAYLTYAIVAIPTLVPQLIPPAYQAGIGESRFEHYFGWGCGDVHPCFDQTAITLLFYIAAAYSIGALFARMLPNHSNRASRREFWTLLFAGCVFLSLSVLGLTESIIDGWTWSYLGLVTVPAGIGAFLILYAVILRRRSSTKDVIEMAKS